MAIEETQGSCRRCGLVLARRSGTNHVLHFLITIFSCSLWIPFWIMISLKFGGWQCPICGGGAKVRLSFGSIILISLVFFLFILIAFGVVSMNQAEGQKARAIETEPVETEPVETEPVETEASLLEEQDWRSKDGRQVRGTVSNIDRATGTVTFKRSDGEVFEKFPISNFDDEDAESIFRHGER
jgi:hypothetical protein